MVPDWLSQMIVSRKRANWPGAGRVGGLRVHVTCASICSALRTAGRELCCVRRSYELI